MQSNYQHSFKLILEDFLAVLQKRSRSLVWKYAGEADPLEINETDFSFQPAAFLKQPFTSEKIRQKFYQKDACTLCPRRMSYKRGQFEGKAPEFPLLMIVHNAFLGANGRTYHNPQVENEFIKLLQESLKLPPEKFLQREALRCHFGAEEIYNETQVKNCQTHLSADIQKYKIKAILIIGEAAPIIFQEKEELSDRMNQISEFMGLPTMVTYGPSRISFMKKNRYPADKIALQRQAIIKNIQQISLTMR